MQQLGKFLTQREAEQFIRRLKKPNRAQYLMIEEWGYIVVYRAD